MIVKKHSKSRRSPDSKIFIQLGLALTLFVIYIALEWKNAVKSIDEPKALISNTEIIEEIPITKTKPLTPPSPEKIEIIKDNVEIEETVLDPRKINRSEEDVIQEDNIIKDVETEGLPEDIPFGGPIEEAPVYPGCEGTTQEKKKCLQDNIDKLVENNFNTGFLNELGLAPGKVKVYLMFEIDKSGNITDIQARGPHTLLEKEAMRVAEMIPPMTPGKLRKIPVGVKYTLPITLLVE